MKECNKNRVLRPQAKSPAGSIGEKYVYARERPATNKQPSRRPARETEQCQAQTACTFSLYILA
jgi:hypothetical protein